ncbi:MAG: hypothetical protein OXK80_02565 [Bdellovibrionales bacterium]|nr:hypothetical protein [Bdellovibrionales bacterium]
MMCPSKESWLKNYEFFKTKLPSLIQKNEGKFAVVQNEKVIDIFDTEDLARQYIRDNNLIPGSFLVQEITNKIEYISRINVNS